MSATDTGSVQAQWALIAQAVARSRAAPLSPRRAMGAVVALDQLCDLAFDARGGLAQPFAGMPDILAFRAALRAHSPALGLVMDLGAAAKDGPWLEVVDWQVAPQDMGALPVVDLMVSLYGGGQVPRLAVAQAGRAIVLVQSLFDQVIADLKALMPMVSGQR